MRDVGSVIAALGAAGFLAVVFLMPTSVDATAYGGGEVTNLALQQRQMLAAIGSAAIFLAGVILHAAGALAPSEAAKPLTAEDEATMQRLGITRDAHGYHVAGYVYSKLATAVKAAEKG